MPDTRYLQFCALARAAEVIGERWTLLIVRELLLGPKRFTDLRDRLDGISPSVLTERLARAKELELVRRVVLPLPAASTVYELTEHGRALRPAVFELIRWDGRFLFPPRKGERIEPEWMVLALGACARRAASPPRSFLLRIRPGLKEAVLHVADGPAGTVVTDRAAPADVTVVATAPTVLALMSGRMTPVAALARGQIKVTGDGTALGDLPQLFDPAQTNERVSHDTGAVIRQEVMMTTKLRGSETDIAKVENEITKARAKLTTLRRRLPVIDVDDYIASRSSRTGPTAPRARTISAFTPRAAARSRERRSSEAAGRHDRPDAEATIRAG